jgi:uncharacterized lipoprotein
MPRIRASLLAAATTVLLLPGCSVSTGTTQIDRGKAERFVKQAFKQPPRSVTCPSGVAAKAGGTLICKVTTASGHLYNVTLHIVNGNGRVQVGPSDVKPAR